MEIVYILLPLSILLACVGLGAYIWALKSGQFRDLDTPQIRVLLDDEIGNNTGRKEIVESDESNLREVENSKP